MAYSVIVIAGFMRHASRYKTNIKPLLEEIHHGQ